MSFTTTPITPGSGANVKVDSTAGGLIQVAKIDIGAENASIPLVGDATYGIPMDIKRSVAIAVTDNSGSITVDSGQLPTSLVSGRLDVVVGAALPAGSNLVGKATVSQGGNDATVSAGGALKVDNSAVTQPVSYANEATGADKSTFTEGTSRVEVMGAVFNDTISSDPAEDQRSPLRITAKKGLHVNLRASAGTETGTAGAPLRIDPTGSTTQPVLDTNSAAALTSLQLLDDTVSTTGSAVTAKGILAVGTDGTNARAISTETDGRVRVTDAGGSITVDSPQLPAALVGGRMDVVVGAALPAGTALVGKVNVQGSGNDAVVSAAGALATNLAQVAGATVSTAASGIPKVGLTDEAGANFTDSNPLQVSNSNLHRTIRRSMNSYTASQTDQAIITPTASTRLVVESILLKVSTAGVLQIFAGSNSADNMLLEGNFAIDDLIQVVFPNGHPLDAVNEVLRYTTGAGATGRITVFGYEV